MQFGQLRRREFIALLGGAAAWPLVARAQQPAMPVIGIMSTLSPASISKPVAGFHQGLGEAGYVEGQNVAIEYRWAQGHYDRLPELAADLVRRRVAVIVASGGDPSPQIARTATQTIPIVFGMRSRQGGPQPAREQCYWCHHIWSGRGHQAAATAA
jgi:putative ABC transport system substrate-binding protein